MTATIVPKSVWPLNLQPKEKLVAPLHQLFKQKDRGTLNSAAVWHTLRSQSRESRPWVKADLIIPLCTGHLSAAQGSGYKGLCPNFRRRVEGWGHGVLASFQIFPVLGNASGLGF